MLVLGLLVPTLALVGLSVVSYFLLKKQNKWYLGLMIILIIAFVGFLIGSIVTGIYSEDQEIAFATDRQTKEQDSTVKMNSSKVSNSSSLTFLTNNFSFLMAICYSFISLYSFVAYLIVACFIYNVYQLNASRFDLDESTNKSIKSYK
jgi:hypothetical protein